MPAMVRGNRGRVERVHHITEMESPHVQLIEALALGPRSILLTICRVVTGAIVGQLVRNRYNPKGSPAVLPTS
jgi:hypothetical protein